MPLVPADATVVVDVIFAVAVDVAWSSGNEPVFDRVPTGPLCLLKTGIGG